MRQIFFCKIDQSNSSSLRNENILLLHALPCLALAVNYRTIVVLFRRVRTRKAAQFFVSGVKNEQRSRGIGGQCCLKIRYQHKRCFF